MAVTQNEASRVADRLRHIADHLDLIGQVDLPADPSTGDRSLTVARTLEVCLQAILQNPGIANSSVRNAKPCVILKRIRVDAMMTILSFLDTKSLVKFAMTCWAMHRVIVKADYIWKCLAEINFPMWCFTIRDTPKNALADQTSIWRKLYLERIYADHPWKTKKTPDVMVKRFQRGIHALYFDRDTLLLGSGQYNEVLSFDLKTGRLHSGANGPGMFGHSQAVTALRPLKQNPELLMTSSLDTSLRLFNRTSMHLLKAYLGHTDKIWCVDVHENRVFSGRSDKTVRIWDLDSTESVCEPLRSHRTSISAIKVMTNLSAPLLLTGSAGNTIRVWDLANGEPRCIEKLRGHTKGVFSLQATPNVLMSGSLDNVIKVWDPRQNWRLVYDLRQKDARGQDLVAYTEDTDTNIGVIAFQCDDTKVVSGGPDKMLRVWDLRTRSIVNEFGGHDHWITTLQFDENKIVTGSRDKTVRFWDISGKLLQELHPSFHDPDDNPQLPPALGPPAVAPPI